MSTHQIDPGDFFRHRMLHLNSWIHFDEIELVGFGIEQKLDRPRAVVSNLPGDRHRRFMQFACGLLAQVGGRRDFYYLLMTALDGTIAFVQMKNVPMLIPKNLHFDVTRFAHQLFQKHFIASKCILGFPLSLLQIRFQCIL